MSALSRTSRWAVADPASNAFDEVGRALELRGGPAVSPAPSGPRWPWARATRFIERARERFEHAQLASYERDLEAVARAREVLNLVVEAQVAEAVAGANADLACRGEAERLSIICEAHLHMARRLAESLEAMECLRGSLTPEILEALKGNVLAEVTAAMNRASRAVQAAAPPACRGKGRT